MYMRQLEIHLAVQFYAIFQNRHLIILVYFLNGRNIKNEKTIFKIF